MDAGSCQFDTRSPRVAKILAYANFLAHDQLPQETTLTPAGDADVREEKRESPVTAMRRCV
jgi:hypothetical protein